MEGLDEEWNRVAKDVADVMLENEDEEEDQEARSRRARASANKPLLSFMQSCKSKIYNIYKSYPKADATFSSSPIYFLGKEYHAGADTAAEWLPSGKRLSLSCPSLPSAFGSSESEGMEDDVLSCGGDEDEDEDVAGEGDEGAASAEVRRGELNLDGRAERSGAFTAPPRAQGHGHVRSSSHQQQQQHGKGAASSAFVGSGFSGARSRNDAASSSSSNSFPSSTSSTSSSSASSSSASSAASSASSSSSSSSLTTPTAHEPPSSTSTSSTVPPSLQQSFPLSSAELCNTRYHVTSDEMRPFMTDFFSRIWITYRSNFPPFPGTSFSSDMGWGCMVRTAQMMLAQALTVHLLGRDWTLKDSDPATTGMHLQILRWFLDKPGLQYPYSIHCIMSLAKKFGKKPGEWFEPSTIMQVLKILVRRHSPGSPSLTMYVAREQTIFKDSVYALCSADPHNVSSPRLRLENPRGGRRGNGGESSSSSGVPGGIDTESSAACTTSEDDMGHFVGGGAAGDESDSLYGESGVRGAAAASGRRDSGVELEVDADNKLMFRPVVIVVPLRLGLATINPIYFAQLLELLEFPQSLGFIGGKPNSSLYFVGYQDDDLLYLDPHFVQHSVSYSQRTQDSTYHCRQPLKMHMTEIDPTLAVGFYCGTPEEFEDLCIRLQTLSGAEGLPAIGVGHRDPYKADRDNEVDPFFDDAVLV